MTSSTFLHYLAAIVVLAPALGFFILALIGTTNYRRDEHLVTRITAISMVSSIVAALLTVFPLLIGQNDSTLEVLYLPLLPGFHDQLEFGLFIDRLNAPFVILTALLSGIVGVFSQPYLHRDPSHYRFFLLLLLFVHGMHLLFMGTSFKVLFIGWEIVGLTSALLISFYYTKRAPIEGALGAFWLYRFGDTALLLSSAILASQFGGEQFHGISTLSGHAGAPFPAEGSAGVALLILILVAAAIKSAQFPFSGWLPRAMEGPTPSSAIFYGGLAVHAGFYLLLRLSTEYRLPFWFNVAIGIIGFISTFYGSIIGRMQCDIKGALAFASLSQVGIMFLEVALGLHALAIIHFMGHASFRMCQILSAGSLIHEARPQRSVQSAAARGSYIPAWIKSSAFNLGAGQRGALLRLLNLFENIGMIFSNRENSWLLCLGSGMNGHRKKAKYNPLVESKEGIE